MTYFEKCIRCHGDMAGFTEHSLRLSEGSAVLKGSGEKLVSFLPRHVRLSREEIESLRKGMAAHLEKRRGQ